MSTPEPKKKLKARHPTIKRSKSRPQCPMHGTVMEFNVENMLFSCPNRGCTQVAFPKAEVSKGKPILGRGEVELFVMDDPKTKKTHYLLRSADNNVMIDVTDSMFHGPTFKSSLAGIELRLPFVDGR